MKIRRPFGLTGFEIALTSVLGVIGGVYIWKPVIGEYEKSIEKYKTRFLPEETKND